MRYAAGILLLLAASCSQDLSTPAPARSAVHAQPAREMAQLGLVDPGDPRSGLSARRNVFAYPEPGRVSVLAKREPVAQSPVMTTTLVKTDTSVPEKKDFPFPYRYIGRFGPEDGQLAAFVADGQATVVKAGQVLGGKYLVKTIGLESVEVSPLSAPELRKTLEVGQ